MVESEGITLTAIVVGAFTENPWRPSIGDPTFAGWGIVTGYLLAACACGWAMCVARIGAKMAAEHAAPERRARDRTKAYKASRAFWRLLVVLFILLGFNKQLDFQIWLTEFGRHFAHEQGWSHHRRTLQAILVGAIAMGGLTTLALLLKATRELLPRHMLAFAGIVLLACFLLARTLSFHHLDAVLMRRMMGIEVVYMLELAGIGMVGLCAVMNCWWYKLGPAGIEGSAQDGDQCDGAESPLGEPAAAGVR